MAATRWRTSSPRARTTARSARVASENGVSVRSWWWRSRRYSAITLASPASDLAPETTSPSRQALMALARTGTTGWPASNSRSTSRPSGRSSATGSPAGGPSRRRRATRSSNPAAEWGMRKARTVVPVWSSTQTACSVDAQSIPTNMRTTSWKLAGPVGEEDSAGWSLTGARSACLYCRSEALGRPERGGVLLALEGRPTLAGAPALTEPYNQDRRQPSSKQGWTSDRCWRRGLAMRAAGVWAAAGQLRAPGGHSRAAGPDPLPQAAHPDPHRRMPAHPQDLGGRLDPARLGRHRRAWRLGPGDAAGAACWGARPQGPRRAGAGSPAQQAP